MVKTTKLDSKPVKDFDKTSDLGKNSLGSDDDLNQWGINFKNGMLNL